MIRFGLHRGLTTMLLRVLTIKTIYDNKELEEMSHAHVVVAKIQKCGGR